MALLQARLWSGRHSNHLPQSAVDDDDEPIDWNADLVGPPASGTLAPCTTENGSAVADHSNSAISSSAQVQGRAGHSTQVSATELAEDAKLLADAASAAGQRGRRAALICCGSFYAKAGSKNLSRSYILKFAISVICAW